MANYLREADRNAGEAERHIAKAAGFEEDDPRGRLHAQTAAAHASLAVYYEMLRQSERRGD